MPTVRFESPLAAREDEFRRIGEADDPRGPRIDGAQVATSALVLESVLTCPQCGQAKTEVMPVDACQFFYECEHCHAVLRPLPGDCCVFCSYGSVKCPPVQIQQGCSSCDRSVASGVGGRGRRRW